MDLRYPIGPFDFAAPVAPETRPQLIDQIAVAPETRPQLIDQIAAAPARLREAVRDLTDDQLDTPYRPGGWTVRQTVHHVADSHMNSYVRLRLALTAEEPGIKI